MKISKKIILTAVLLIFAGGLYFYNKILPNDLAGNYVSVMPNFLERKIIFKTHNIKGAVFSDNGTKKLTLNKDFTQKYVSYYGKGDSITYKGTWKVKNDSLILHFNEGKSDIRLSRLQFTNKLYNVSNLIRCSDSVAVKNVSVFKKLK